MERKQYKVELPELVSYELGKYVDGPSGKTLNGKTVWSSLKPLKDSNHVLVWASLDKEGYVPFLVHASWLVLLKEEPKTLKEWYLQNYPENMEALDPKRVGQVQGAQIWHYNLCFDVWEACINSQQPKAIQLLDRVRKLWNKRMTVTNPGCTWVAVTPTQAATLTELLET